MKSRHPSIAWRDMAGAGNVYRHDCDDGAARHVWHTFTHDLPPLRLVVLEELRKFGEESVIYSYAHLYPSHKPRIPPPTVFF